MTGFKSKKTAALDEEGMYLVHQTAQPEQEPQRPWVDLTPQDLNEIFAIARTGEHAVNLALDKVKEKNT
jgi:hypothetical protein